MEQITRNVYVETGFMGCNTSFVVTGEGVVLIDTPMVPADAKKWAEEIARHGPLRYVINTEPHGDHYSGNGYFGGTVVAHEGTRQAILRASVEDMRQMLQRMAPGGPPLDADFHYRPPEITLSQRLTLYLGKHTFHLINLPGHTPYQVAVHVPEERVVFTSDNLNLGTPVFRDSQPDHWLESLKQYEELDIDLAVPGHGEVTGKDSFAAMGELIRSWLDAVRAAIEGGMSLEEAQQKLPSTPPFSTAPQEGPMLEFLRGNIERIYRFLKK